MESDLSCPLCVPQTFGGSQEAWDAMRERHKEHVAPSVPFYRLTPDYKALYLAASAERDALKAELAATKADS